MNFIRILRHRLVMIIGLSQIISACVNPSEITPPDRLPPTISLYKPASHDTVLTGATEISYDASDDEGIGLVELFVDGGLHSRHPGNEDGSRPTIFLELNDTFKDLTVNYNLVVYDLNGNSTTSETMRDIFVKLNLLPPTGPDNLVISKLTHFIVNLRWRDNSHDELGFELWRQPSGQEYSRRQTLPPGSISCNDTITDLTKTYKYKIRAFNAYTFSESEEVSTSELKLNIVSAPANLTAIAYGTGWVRLLWEDKSAEELAFILQRKNAGATVYSHIADLPPNSNQYDDRENLFPNTYYTYRIAALGTFGQSDWSNAVSVSTLTFDLNPPSNLHGVYDGTSRVVKLEWNDSSIYEVETRIERKNTPDGPFAEIGSVGENVTMYADSTAAVNATYIYRVRSFVPGATFSDYSNEAVVNTNN